MIERLFCQTAGFGGQQNIELSACTRDPEDDEETYINSKHTILDPSQNSNVARQQVEVVFMAYTQIHMHMLMHECEYSFPAVSCVLVLH